MKSAKRSGKSSAKKSVTPKKTSSDSLATLLLEKHQKAQAAGGESANQTALLLQTILSGTDEQLQTVLEAWTNLEAIQGVIGSWGPSNTKLLFHRICSLIGDSPCPWAYAWTRQILKSNLSLNEKDIKMLQGHLSNENRPQIEEVLKFEGKLDIFDH